MTSSISSRNTPVTNNSIFNEIPSDLQRTQNQDRMNFLASSPHILYSADKIQNQKQNERIEAREILAFPFCNSIHNWLQSSWGDEFRSMYEEKAVFCQEPVDKRYFTQSAELSLATAECCTITHILRYVVWCMYVCAIGFIHINLIYKAYVCSID